MKKRIFFISTLLLFHTVGFAQNKSGADNFDNSILVVTDNDTAVIHCHFHTVGFIDSLLRSYSSDIQAPRFESKSGGAYFFYILQFKGLDFSIYPEFNIEFFKVPRWELSDDELARLSRVLPVKTIQVKDSAHIGYSSLIIEKKSNAPIKIYPFLRL